MRDDLPDDPLEPVHEALTEFEARTIVAVLEDAGIRADVFVLGNLGLPHSLAVGATGIPVMVRRSMLERARTVLRESREVGSSIDWDSIDEAGQGERVSELPRPLAARFLGARLRTFGLWIVGALLAMFVAALVASVPLSYLHYEPRTAEAVISGVAVSAFAIVIAAMVIREWRNGPDNSEL